ncbi:MAG: transcription elongation factor GreA [Patescibacteria group bacterium]|nr:transcription elongation factor GreA [Patescibacteria group bacterium]
MSDKPVYVSKEGLKKLKEELVHLKTVKKPEVAKRIEEAKELGDLKENAEYHDAKDQMGWVMGRVIQLESEIGHAQIVEKTNGDTVGIGSSVKVKYGDKEKVMTVVGATEADPIQGLISNDSPLGQALIGKKVGDKVEVEVPAGKIMYSILEVS